MSLFFTDKEIDDLNLKPCCGSRPMVRHGDYYESDPHVIECWHCNRLVKSHYVKQAAADWNHSFDKCGR